MQTVLVIAALVYSLVILGKLIYRTWFSPQDQCAGCAIKKMHDQSAT